MTRLYLPIFRKALFQQRLAVRETGTRINHIQPTAKAADSRAGVYAALSIWLLICVAGHLYFVVAVFSNAIFWLTYYVANYEFGFVRRGLAGELIRVFPDDQHFTAGYSILWVSIVGWLIAVGVLMRMVVSRGTKSERRIMLALTIPVMPFSFSYAVYSPRPELFGMTALLAFSVAMTRVSSPRWRMIVSAVYGIAMAVLALVHEAIPLVFALGAVLALVVLPKGASRAARRSCAVLAVGPGIASALSVALMGRHDVAARLCAQVPHGMVDDPWAVVTTPQNVLDYLLGRIESRSDYHDWVCKNTTPIHDADLTAAIQKKRPRFRVRRHRAGRDTDRGGQQHRLMMPHRSCGPVAARCRL